MSTSQQEQQQEQDEVVQQQEEEQLKQLVPESVDSLFFTTNTPSSSSSTDSSTSSSPLHNPTTNESIRKLIAANFASQHPPIPSSLSPLHNQLATHHSHHSHSHLSNNDQPDTPPNNTTSPATTTHSHKKSHSISIAVLAHSKTTSPAKKVSFSNLHSDNSSQVFTSSSSTETSENSSDNDNEDEDEETQANTIHNQTLKAPFRRANFTTSVTPSPASLSPTVSYSGVIGSSNLKNSCNNRSKSKLNKFSSYGGERLSISKSLDSQLLEQVDSNSSVNSLMLPEFNKRPLTDTPIVSSMGSPITRYQSSEEDYESEKNQTTTTTTIAEEEEHHAHHPLKKTRNISDLNLSDMAKRLEMTPLSPPRATEPVSVEPSAPGMVNTASTFLKHPDLSQPRIYPISKSDSISPMTSTPNLDQQQVKKSSGQQITMKPEIKKSLLKDVPDDIKEQFEKTPSIEKLKNLLMTKPPPSARKAYTLNIPGQTSSKISPDGKIARVDVGSKLVIVMVGLPARGKSYITNKLTRYLNWLQHDCRVFNVGNTRRKDKQHNVGPEKKPLPDHTPTGARSPNPEHHEEETEHGEEHDAAFFSPDNKANTAIREKWAMDTLDQLLDYIIDGPGSVGIFDATNSTKSRRRRVLNRINERSGGELKVLFLESICNDPNILESNIRLKLLGPDYKEMDPAVALADFVGRLHNYEKAYETIDDAEEKSMGPGFQYVKIIDVGKKIVSYNIKGFLSSQTVYFLLNFNLCERQIWITRHGESKDNVSGRIGGDSHLTKRGIKFSKTLARFMNFQRQEFRKMQLERFSSRLELKYNSIFNEDDVATLDNIPTEPNFCVWTSMLIRSIETGQYFNDQLYSVKQMRMLNELGGGKYEGMTYDEIQQQHPKEFEARIRDKLTYRYPGIGGESYLDVLNRVRPVITEIERTTDHLLIISHRVVLRILLAYFLNLDKSSIGELDVPLHTLYCLELKPYGTDYTMYEYDEHLDWFVKAEPEHQKNVQEVGIQFRQRKYSVVPTAPPSFSSRRGKLIKKGGPGAAITPGGVGFGIDRLPTGLTRDGDDKSITKKNLQDLRRLRKPAAAR